MITSTSNTLTQPSSIHVEGNWPFKIVRNLRKNAFFSRCQARIIQNQSNISFISWQWQWPWMCVCCVLFYACSVMFTCWGESKDIFPRLVGQWRFYSNHLITLFYMNISPQHWNCVCKLRRYPVCGCYMYIMKHWDLWKTAYGKWMSFVGQSAVCECAITAH